MIQLNNAYNRDDFLKFLEDNFLTDFKKDIRPASTQGFSSIQKAYSLGRSDSLDLQVFEFSFEGSPNKRVTLTKDAFQVMRSSAIFRALAIFHSPDSNDWRLSLMTATPERTEKGKVALSYSNPKRLSFFLGPNAKVNTPTKFILKKDKITDFEDLKSRFSIEVVNKEFYKEISQTFTKLINGLLKLPATHDKSQANLEFAVRLIGRVIFCWFLREKKSEVGIALMPKDLLSLEAVIKNKDYYHKILEPIFFEVLNKPVKSRKEDFTKEPFSSVPYLNGGLFSPQEDDYYKRTNGDFQSQYHNTLVIPDSWIKSFFEILETYNFTIDENTSYDEELSIDPEMLGRIFENLLAEINPETGESARKNTGSYYTPRAIVNYMIDESLLLYLKEQTGISEDKLKAIISYDLGDDVENPVADVEKEKLVDALEKIKILDPACGSGAFPIGALQKILFILQQIDPNGQLWFKKQIVINSPEIKRVIEREFTNKNFDYIRKLGIIRENIYGIDIQPIATEISRLRCFLTLVVDQRIQDDTENRGIEPLPNLDFKFVTANTLIALPGSQASSQVGLFEDNEGISQLKELRDMFFNASGAERDQLKLQFVQAQNRMFQRLISEGRRGHAELTTKLTTWDPFSHKSSSWFDPEWMFGQKEKFDIVIANPPWVFTRRGKFDKSLKKIITETYLSDLKGSQTGHAKQSGKINLYAIFILFSIKILKENGLMTFITPNTLLRATIFDAVRKHLLDKTSVSRIVDLSKGIFENVTASTIIIILQNAIPFISHDIKILQSLPIDQNYKEWKVQQNTFLKNISYGFNIYINDIGSSLIEKINKNSVRLDKCFDVVGGGIATGPGKNNYISNRKLTNQYKPLIEGKDIKQYKLLFSNKYILYDPKKLYRSRDEQIFLNPEKLITQRIGGGNYPLIVAYDTNKYYSFNSTNTILNKKNGSTLKLKYLLALMNSRLLNWYFKFQYTNKSELTVNISKTYLEQLPIKEVSDKEQLPIINMVDRLLKTNRPNEMKVIMEEMDQLVYKLYDLTTDEISIIENSTNEQ